MKKRTRVLVYGLALVTAGSATAGYRRTALAGEVRTGEHSRQTGKPQGSVTVEGSDLRSKLKAARGLARGRGGRLPFWVAYSFPVRAGIAFDSVPGVSGIVGGNVAGYETRNLGVFLLLDPGDEKILRVKTINLDREIGEQVPTPVYWLGAGETGESLSLLEEIVREASGAAGAATVVVALHDDADRVATLLRDFAVNSPLGEVRRTSVQWLGRLPGEAEFLAGVVRDESQASAVREFAVVAIGKSRDPQAVSTLRRLHDSVRDEEVRDKIMRMLFKRSKARRAGL